jgi:hypothetical protein
MENGVMEYMETASLRDSRFKTDVDGKTATCVSSPTFRYADFGATWTVNPV